MSELSIPPTFPIFTETDGLPLENGYIWIGTTNLDPQGNPINVYWDAALTILAPQPIRTINGYPSRSGTPGRLYVNSDYSIRVQNGKGSLVYSAPAATERISSDLVTFIQAGTGAVNRTVQSKLRDVVSVKDFGATGLGYPNDDAAAIQAAFDAHQCIYFPEGEYYIGSSVTPQGNSLIFGSGRESHIIIKDGDTNGIDLTNKTGVTVRDLKLSCRGSVGTLGGLSGKAAIYLSNSGQCTIENNFIFNCYNVGIRLYNSSNNKIRNNYFGDWYTTSTANEDTGNIYCLGSCSYNTIEGNFCLGINAGVGVGFTDYYIVGAQMVGNLIANNRVATKKAYGIMFYTTGVSVPLGYDCRLVVTGNSIDTVYGDYITGNSGAGIYLQGAGGAICSNNSVYNTCVNTTVFGTLLGAGITANINDAVQTAAIQICNNTVHTLRGPAIWAGSSRQHGILVDGNIVRSDDTTSGFSTAIRMSLCEYSNITNNSVYHQGPAAAIYVDCVNSDCNRLNVSNNTIHTTNATSVGIGFDRAVSGEFYNVVISGNTVNSAQQGMQLAYLNYASVTNNKVLAGVISFYLANGSYIMCQGNTLISNQTGTAYDVILAEGTGSVFDETNVITERFQHTGLGIVQQYTYTTAPPIYGQYQIGDRVINRGAVVGQPLAWRCTVAGEPGTWTSEGNL